MKTTLDFNKGNGLVPVIVQDAATLQVLMLAYMNQEAFEQTVSTKKATFFSRSRNALWIKGETSGNYLHLVNWFVDCDNDTLLLTVTPDGPACHRSTVTCFDELEDDGSTVKRTPPSASETQFLTKLQDLLETRKKDRPEGSYTTRLFDKGTDKIAQKVGEEAIETVIAAKNDNEELRYEASDLLFHLMVLLTEKGMRIEDLARELASRHKPG